MNGLSGLVSGIDTAALVEAVLAQQRQPIAQLQQQREAVDIKVSRFGDFMSKLGSLKTTLEDTFTNLGDTLAHAATSGDEDIFTATATGEATAGNYDIDVDKLAKHEKNRSDAFTSEFAPITAGTLSIGTGPSPEMVDITIEEGDTLKDLVDKINASGAEVSAGIVKDGTSAYLQITAQQSGYDTAGTANEAVTITESYTGSTGQALGMTQIQKAQNAEFTVDGLDVVSRDNTVEDVLPGITFELKSEGASTLTVDMDKEGTVENIQAFVDAFNEIAQLIDEELDIQGEQNRDRSLSGESSMRTLQTEMFLAASGPVTGAGLENSPFKALADIGITRDDNGKLTIDETELEDALAKDAVAVANVFGHVEPVVDENDADDPGLDLSNPVHGLTARLSKLVDRFVGTSENQGIFENRKDALTDSLDFIDERIERTQTRVSQRQTTLERQFIQMELVMAQLQTQSGALASLAGITTTA